MIKERSLTAVYYFRSFPLRLHLLFLASLFVVLFNQFFLVDLNLPVYRFEQIAYIIERLLLSILASILFYFITQHVPRMKRRMATFILVQNVAIKLHNMCRDMTRTIVGANFIDEPQSPSRMNIQNSISHRTLVSPVLFHHNKTTYDTWLHLLVYVHGTTNEIYSLMLPLLDLLPHKATNHLLNLVELINVLINPSTCLETETELTPEQFSRLIHRFIHHGYEFHKEMEKLRSLHSFRKNK